MLPAEQRLDLRQRPDQRDALRGTLAVQVAADDLRGADTYGHAARPEARLVVYEHRGLRDHPEPAESVPEYLRRRLGRTYLAGQHQFVDQLVYPGRDQHRARVLGAVTHDRDLDT